MKELDTEKILSGALMAAEVVVLGGVVVTSIIGATFGATASLLVAGAESIRNKRLGKEEDNYRFTVGTVKDIYASVVGSCKGYFATTDRRAPLEDAGEVPSFKAHIFSETPHSEGTSLSEDERDELDVVIKVPQDSEVLEEEATEKRQATA